MATQWFETTDDPDVADIYFKVITQLKHIPNKRLLMKTDREEIDVAQPVTLTLPKLTKKGILHFAN